MPTIKTIREALVANDIRSIKTIINGTSNYILTQMATRHIDFQTALGEAQAQGYAEADPTLDVGGGDAGHKVAIMASLVHGGYVPFEKMSIEGITTITAEDVAVAAELGYAIKLLGIIRKGEADADVDVRVHPAMLHRDHSLASVNGVLNAVLLEGDAVGPILLSGRGAGEMPTASAVVSDVVDVARNILSGTPLRISMGYYSHVNALKLRPLDLLETRYYLRFSVRERPGVLAKIADAFGRHGISIASVIQKETSQVACLPVIFLTHRANEKNLRGAVAEVETLDFIQAKTQVIRIEE
jgi:homoserine dehydrogenase